MKTYFLLPLFILIAFSDNLKAQSNDILKLLNEKNTPISKKSEPIGSLDENVLFDVLTVENMIDGNVLHGLVLTVVRGGYPYYNVLDKAEIQTFIKALKRVESKLNDEEFRTSAFKMTSGSGISFSSKYDSSGIWIHKLELIKNSNEAIYSFGNKGLNQLVSNLELAIAKIK
ncbi:hypothetical protein [Pedobacter antarcticus]|uniref:hypothetical protein n=1 Tax=Pedobacter antarcticus TaxID=34086 RepID=UPI0008890E5C|nr:hypothetical protein [Pedobacter antarcticus]SDM40594.1 hypothetical protein SAMN04488084_106171 [Pedobacter antarcticus]